MFVIRTLFVAAILTSALIVFPETSHAQFKTPEETIKAVYDAYSVGDKPGNVEIDDGGAFDKPLLKLYRRATKNNCLNFDFFVQGQDYYFAKPIEITKTSIVGSKAKVFATLTQDRNSGHPPPQFHSDTFIFTLIKENGDWKIDDAVNHGITFRHVLREAISEKCR